MPPVCVAPSSTGNVSGVASSPWWTHWVCPPSSSPTVQQISSGQSWHDLSALITLTPVPRQSFRTQPLQTGSCSSHLLDWQMHMHNRLCWQFCQYFSYSTDWWLTNSEVSCQILSNHAPHKLKQLRHTWLGVARSRLPTMLSIPLVLLWFCVLDACVYHSTYCTTESHQLDIQ